MKVTQELSSLCNFSVSLKSIQNKKLNSRKYKYKQIGGKSFPETKRNSEPRSFNPASSFCAYPLVFPSPLSQHAGHAGFILTATSSSAFALLTPQHQLTSSPFPMCPPQAWPHSLPVLHWSSLSL